MREGLAVPVETAMTGAIPGLVHQQQFFPQEAKEVMHPQEVRPVFQAPEDWHQLQLEMSDTMEAMGEPE